jgi:hypothetical protein
MEMDDRKKEKKKTDEEGEDKFDRYLDSIGL